MNDKEFDAFVADFYDKFAKKRGPHEAQYAIITSWMMVFKKILLENNLVQKSDLYERMKADMLSLDRNLDKKVGIPSPFSEKDDIS